MEWFFFVLLNAAFFVRPGDLMQSADFPVYNFTMIACLILAGPRVVEVARSWRQSPITTCVLGMVAACLLSHMSRAYFGRAVEDGIYLVKIIIYYLVFVAIVNSPARLQSFLRWFVVFTLVLTGLALAHWHELVSIECLAACQQYEFNSVTGQIEVIPRLRSTGVFNDPNDLSMVLIVGVIICLYIIDNARRGLGRFLWLAPIATFLYALKLTYSRGGLLNFAISLMVVSWYRLGWKKTMLVSAVLLPAMLILFGGRMTKLDIEDTGDTSQHRIQIWSRGLLLFRESPVFGVGMNEFNERAGIVAHNSFVHTYAELGFFGGTLFVGAFYAGYIGVARLGKNPGAFRDPALPRLYPYILAMIVSYCAGMFSLSRPYTITTYTILGIVAAYLHVAETNSSLEGLRFDARFIQRLLLVGVACTLFLYLFVRLTVRFE